MGSIEASPGAPACPVVLYHADRLGHLVWREFGDWGCCGEGPFGGAHRKPGADYITQWLEVLERDYSHPCIVGRCPLNKTWQVLGDRITVLDDMTRGMFLATKANGAALRHPQHGRLSYDCFMQTADEHLAEFKRDGLTLFPKMLDAAWAREMRDAFEQIADSDRDEAIVFPQAGDVALFHGSMLP